MANLVEQLHGKHVFADIDDAQRRSFEALRDNMRVNGARAFLIAASYGFLTASPLSEFQPSRAGLARCDTFTYASHMEMLVMALGYASGCELEDFDGCWRKCEELAAGGMAMLQSELESQSGIRERLSEFVWEQLRTLGDD